MTLTHLTGGLLVLVLAASVVGCGAPEDEPPPPRPLDAIARDYVQLVLALGQRDDGYVDYFYGPAEWREAALAERPQLHLLRERARELAAEAHRADPPADAEPMVTLRRRFLARQLEAVESRVDLLLGERLRFDEESRALYDVVAPHHGAEHYQAVLDELDALLTAEGFADGALIERYDHFRQAFVIPPARVDAVFRLAIEACRERTAVHVDLPEGESFEVEYVRDRPWSAYNWYQGGYHSLIQVNTDLPIYIDRALDLACHEGYPGHHVYNALLEKHLVEERGWVEFTVYPLFSPQSLIAEGTANYGIEMAFPGEERQAFERDVLFPAAGLDPTRAGAYLGVHRLVKRLAYADNEAARAYLDGEKTGEETVEWLTRYRAMTPARAEQRLAFMDTYRSYVINYNVGEDVAREYVERNGDTEDARWAAFERLLSTPQVPSSLE